MCIGSSTILVEKAMKYMILHSSNPIYMFDIEGCSYCRDGPPGDMFLMKDQPLIPCERLIRKEMQACIELVS